MESHCDFGKYKLIIPDNVEKIIRNLCALSPDNEWSGILFYTFEGDFDTSLTLTCRDILVLDQGSAGATTFDASNPEVARHMFMNQLMGCCVGLIHSHNHMPTFFSGIDTKTLQSEGNDCNNFLSLIVNNAGTYTAAITRKIKRESRIDSSVTINEKYDFFNTGNTINLPEKREEKHNTETSTIVEYFYLTIDKAVNVEASPGLEAFGKVIRKKPESYQKKWNDFNNTPYYKPKSTPAYVDDDDYYDELFKGYGIYQNDKSPYSKSPDTPTQEMLTSEDEALLKGLCRDINWNDKEYLLFLEKTFFGTPFITSTKRNNFKEEVKYVATTFHAACTKTFATVKDMEDWFITSLDYFLYNSVFPTLKPWSIMTTSFEVDSVVAYRISEAFNEYAEKSQYIKAACNILQQRI